MPKVYTNHRRHYIPQAAKGGEGRSLFHMAIQYTLNDDHEQAAATLLSIPNVVPNPPQHLAALLNGLLRLLHLLRGVRCSLPLPLPLLVMMMITTTTLAPLEE